MRKLGFWILILGFLLTAVGCSKTVTPKVSYGSEMVVEVKLRGTVDTINNRYYLVLSTNESFSVPLPPPDNIEYEFLTVGETPQTGSPETYYTNYYSTWTGYIELNNTGYYISTGPYAINTTATQDTLSDLTNISSTLTFNFRLDRIFTGTIPDNIYFDFITVDYPVSQFKRTKDLLYPPTPSIQKFTGAETTVTDTSDSTIDASQDILSVKVNIQ